MKQTEQKIDPNKTNTSFVARGMINPNKLLNYNGNKVMDKMHKDFVTNPD